jgi:hypothetical protein
MDDGVVKVIDSEYASWTIPAGPAAEDVWQQACTAWTMEQP